MTTTQPTQTISRDEAIKAIRQALRERSGKTWSVRGGRGTAWGWLSISAPPARCGDYGEMSAADAAELSKLLDLDHVERTRVSVPASSAHYREYTNRAQGRPYDIAAPYWD